MTGHAFSAPFRIWCRPRRSLPTPGAGRRKEVRQQLYVARRTRNGMGVSEKWLVKSHGKSQNGWLIMENPMKISKLLINPWKINENPIEMDDFWGYPDF